MLRLPAQLELGPYTIHLDVLAARLQRQRRRIRQLTLAGGALSVLAVAAWLLIPLLRGSGTLIVPPLPADVQVHLGDRALAAGSFTLPSGDHTLRVERPGAFPVSSLVQVSRSQTTTLTLPVLRPIPVVQPLPLPHQQSVWLQASPDAGSGWRMTATRPAPAQTGPRPGWGQTQPAPARYQLHLDSQGLTRLSVLETYPVADEIVTTDGERFWAVWEPQESPKIPGVAGNLTLTTPAGTQVISTTASPRGVWWTPGGSHLLVALPHDQGLDLVVVDPERPQIDDRAPLITVPGAVQSIAWSPDWQAAVVITSLESILPTQQGATLPARPTPTAGPLPAETATLERTAVLIQLSQPGESARATRLRVPPARPAGLNPLAWSAGALWWVTDTGLGLALDRVNLADGVTERVGQLPDDLVTLTALPDRTLRIVRPLADGQLAVQRWPDAETLFVLPAIQAQGAAGGVWDGEELILATGPGGLWYIQIQPEALR